MLDETDKTLISELMRDARIPYSELGKKVGMATSTVIERVKKLQANGIIKGFFPMMDYQRIGYDLCAFVQVLLKGSENEDSFTEQVNKMAEVMECHFITGDYSYLLKVRARDSNSLEYFLKNKLGKLPGMERANTIIALSSTKEEVGVAL